MTIAYNWTITATDYETVNGFITKAHWTATAVDEGYSISACSICSWDAGTPTIPYAQVTQQEVLDWCWSSSVDKEATEAALAQGIYFQKNPVTATGTPWSQA